VTYVTIECLYSYFSSIEYKDAIFFSQFDVRLMLVSLDHQITPSLPQPYLCCRPTLSVEHLYEVRSSCLWSIVSGGGSSCFIGS